MTSSDPAFSFFYVLDGLDSTVRTGKLIGASLAPDHVVLLSGEMGSGKTTLAKSICSALDIPSEKVTSPTYTIANRYFGQYEVSHVDLYRLNSSEDLDGFDEDDLICRDGITLVEWSQILMPWLEESSCLFIDLKTPNLRDFQSNIRNLQIHSKHSCFSALFEKLHTLR